MVALPFLQRLEIGLNVVSCITAHADGRSNRLLQLPITLDSSCCWHVDRLAKEICKQGSMVVTYKLALLDCGFSLVPLGQHS